MDLAFSGGSFKQNEGTLSITGSVLIFYDDGQGLSVFDTLGTMSVQTATIATGDLNSGASFHHGGNFTVNGNGVGGIPNGLIFQGEIESANWILVTQANGDHSYEFTGSCVDAQGNTLNFDIHTVIIGQGYFLNSVSVDVADANASFSAITIQTKAAKRLVSGMAIEVSLSRCNDNYNVVHDPPPASAIVVSDTTITNTERPPSGTQAFWRQSK
jgi:hypothetical protein